MTELALAESPKIVKLDFACGNNKKEGFEGVDFYAPTAEHKIDLFKFPFPWADNSVDEIHCSHFVEHLPARDVELRDLRVDLSAPAPIARDRQFVGQDFLFAFFDECWRILKPGSTMMVIVPSGRSDRAYQDPTHRRFIVAELFGYLNKESREQMGLGHYNVRCNFASSITPTIDNALHLRHAEVQALKFREAYNVVHDWHATLITRK
jgi:hypothetical protein